MRVEEKKTKHRNIVNKIGSEGAIFSIVRLSPSPETFANGLYCAALQHPNAES